MTASPTAIPAAVHGQHPQSHARRAAHLAEVIQVH